MAGGFFYNLGAGFFTALTRAPTRATVAAPATSVYAATVSKQNMTLPQLIQALAKDGRITAPDVYEIASRMIAEFPELAGANALMAGAMAMTESGGNTIYVDPNAKRYEPGFLKRYILGTAAELYGRARGFTPAQLATSYGIGQVMLQSAIELYKRGFTRYGHPSPYGLTKVDMGIYYLLAAQADIVKRSGKANESFVVMSYNGGIGANNSQTQNHLAKYTKNKQTLSGLV